MLEIYGKDSFALLVDEGSKYHDPSKWFDLIALIGVFGDIGGSIIAVVGTAEKGYTDTRVKVSTAGGHSSVPPAHTVRYNIFPMDIT
jgi:Gly-Xaa carboxypeptidase